MPDTFVVDWITSYLVGSIPTLKDLFSKNIDLESRIDACYNAALKKWCPNTSVRERVSVHFTSVDSLRAYMLSKPDLKEYGVDRLLHLWSDELQKDEICYNFILETKIDKVNDAVNNIAVAVKESTIQNKAQLEYITQLIQLSKSENYRKIFRYISADLRSWRSCLYDDKHIPRKQTGDLCAWIDAEHSKEKERVALLVGAPGSGKSVVMHDVLQMMEARDDVYVLGLKSDQIGYETIENLARNNGISSRLEDVVNGLSRESGVKRVILLVDQIDALSMSLSSNRAPLRSILRFIENIQINDKVRVVISCRPYDLEYDPYLEQFQFGEKVKMDPLRAEIVEEVLRINGRNEVPANSNLFNTLRTPLFLYLFLKLRPSSKLDTTITEYGLYNRLWSQIINVDGDRVDHQRLLRLLDQITGKMYEAQLLTVSHISLDSAYSRELEYLLHEGMLICVSEDRVQFFHQSLFDYVYARRFVERGDDLLDAIRDRHQGLFIRALVKSIMTFMREDSVERYIDAIRHILFDVTEEGIPAYRFHLKMLVLSMMGYTTNLYPIEVKFAREELSLNGQLLEFFIKGIRCKEWFIAVQDIIDHSAGWQGMSEGDCLLMVGICSQLIHFEQYIVLSYLDKYLTQEISSEVRKKVISTLDFFKPERENVAIAQRLYDRIILEDDDTSLVNLLNNMFDMDPDFVLKRQRRIVSYVIKANKENYRIKDISIDHEVEHLYEKIYEQFPDRAFCEFLSIVKEICDASKLDFKNSDSLTLCLAYMMFTPTSNPQIGYRFSEDVLSIVIQEVEIRAKEEREGIVDVVEELNRSEYDILRVVAASAFVANPQLFLVQILGVFTDSWLLSNCSSLLKYYYRNLLSSAFVLFSHQEQQAILDAVMRSVHNSEKSYVIKEHQKWGGSISLIDELKYEYLSDIPDDILRRDFKSIYRKKYEYMRKFGKRENKRPHQITTHIGWTGLPLGAEGGKKLSHSQWLKAMRKYRHNDCISFETPTLYGSAHQFEEAVAANPDKYRDTVLAALNDPEIPSAYPYAGMKGLITAKYDFKFIQNLFLQMIAKLNQNINENPPSDLIGLVRQSDYFIENSKSLNKEILNFLIKVVREYDDRYEDKEEDEQERAPYQSGINEVRGSACETLVECYRFPEYAEDIFSAFEEIAENSTIHTRSALVFKMALLNNLDAERSLDLFLKLMRDYRPNMMAMPLHNLNPLVYYINFGFPRLKDYFEKCIETPLCHKQMSPLLWLAYARRKDGAEDLLSRMLEASSEAKESLINYLSSCKNQNISQDFIIPWVLKCLQISKPEIELARAYDNIFDDMMEDWSEGVKDEIMGLYVDGGWVAFANHDFIRYLGSMAISNPSKCLKWLNRSLLVTKNLLCDPFSSPKIIEILIQSYNGLSEFGVKTPDLEFAMDLLDKILQERNQDIRLEMFLHKLDNA